MCLLFFMISIIFLTESLSNEALFHPIRGVVGKLGKSQNDPKRFIKSGRNASTVSPNGVFDKLLIFAKKREK